MHLGCFKHKNMFISSSHSHSKGIFSEDRNKIKPKVNSPFIHSRSGHSISHSAEAAVEGRQRTEGVIAKIIKTNIRTASASCSLPAGKANTLLPRQSGRSAIAEVIETEMNTGDRFPRRVSLADQLEPDLLPLYYKNIKTYSLLNSTCK